MSGRRVLDSAHSLARLDLIQLIRSRSTRVVLAVWTALCVGLAIIPIVRGAGPKGPLLFSIEALAAVTASVFGAAVAAGLGAYRDRGGRTMTVLRGTNTLALSLVAAKLMVAVIVAGALVLPPVVIAVVTLFMGVSVVRLLGLVVVCTLFAVIWAAIALGAAHVGSNRRQGGWLAGLTVIFLVFGTFGLYRAAIPSQTHFLRVQSLWQISKGQPCIFRQVGVAVQDTDKIWWMMLPSPYVAAGDILTGGRDTATAGSNRDLLAKAQTSVRDARTGPVEFIDECDDGVLQGHPLNKAPNWPYTLFIDGMLALAAGFLAYRAFRTPRT